ncbi:WD repeat protein, partial [Ichthyophthirius multifiliis]
MNNGKNLIVGDKSGDIYLLDCILNNVRDLKTEDKQLYTELTKCCIETNIENLIDLSPSPNDKKIVIAGEKELHILDVDSAKKEIDLENVSREITSCDWNPQKALILSTDDSYKIRLWDPRVFESLAEISSHNQPVTTGKWHQNGTYFITGGKDHAVKLFDIRKLEKPSNEFSCYSEITCIKWNPMLSNIFVTGDNQGNILHFSVHENSHIDQICCDDKVIDIDFHPLGNIMCFIDNKKVLK